jgi:hypothetical protein
MTRNAHIQARAFVVAAFFIVLALVGPSALLGRQTVRKEAIPKVQMAGIPISFLPAVAYSTGEPGAILNGENNTVAIADVNGDGKPDLLVADYCGSSKFNACPLGESTGMVSVLLGNGDGTFQPPLTYSSGGFYAIAVLVADLNADGKPDLIVANGCTEEPDVCPTEGSVGVLLGNGDGTFQPVQTAATGGAPFAMTVADVNKDGKPDVIVANQGGGNGGDGSVGVLLGTGTGAFHTLQIYDSGGKEADFVIVTDVNNDGKPDVLVTNFSVSVFCQACVGNLGVLLGNGDGTFEQVLTYPADGFASGFVVADMNGDGIPDVIVNEGGIFNGGMFSVLLGNGNGSFRSAVAYSTGGGYNYLPSVVDVNGDHKLDVIVPNGQFCSGFKRSAGCVAILLGNGDGTLQPPVLYAASGGAGWLTVADLNEDAIPDVAFVGQGGGSGGYVGVLEGNGDGTFQPAEVYGTAGYTSTWVGIMDLNGDGKPDMLVENPNPGRDGTLGVLLNTTSFCTTPPVVTLSTTPAVLWPPNGKMVPLTVSGTITDTAGCTVTSATYAVSDEYGQVQPSGSIAVGAGGAYSFTVPLQASRLGNDSDGRLYTVTVSADSNAGKTGSQAGTVMVPHDQGH